mgnify:CR=1 FL=1
MAALGANTARLITPTGKAGSTALLGVKASSTIYQGSALGDSSGAARALVAQDAFMGFALESATGGGSDGLVKVRACLEGYLTQSAITGFSGGVDDIGAAVYMSSDNDLTATSTNNTQIGKIFNYDATNGYTVFFQAVALRSI